MDNSEIITATTVPVITMSCNPRGITVANTSNNTFVNELTIKANIEKLLLEADRAGYVVSVTQEPLKPLAMRNYSSVVSVRKKLFR